MASVTASTAAILCLQLFLLIHQIECQFRIPPIRTSVFAHVVNEPQPDSFSGQDVTVKNGQEFTIQVHLDQTPTEDDYDMFLSECTANGVPFMDNYGCAINARSIALVSMTRNMHVIPKDDTRLTLTSLKNDKFTFLYLTENSGAAAGGSVQIVCSVKYVACQGMTCQRQPGCTNYMSSNSITSLQAVSVTASVRIQPGGSVNGNPETGGGGGKGNPTGVGGGNGNPTTNDLVDKAGIAWWHIALICLVASLLFLAVIALLIVLCCRKNAAESTPPSRPERKSVQRPDSRIYEQVYEPRRHYYTPSENASHATYAPTNVSESRVALAAYNNNRRA